MPMQISGSTGPSVNGDGIGLQPFRQIRTGEMAVSEVHGRYYEQSRRGYLFFARATVTAPAGIASSNGIGGPLLWNGTSTKIASLLAVTCGVTVVTTVAAALGIAGAANQTTTPSSTTAIDSSGNCLIGGDAPTMSTYRIGTVSVVPTMFIPLLDVHTGALTQDNKGLGWIDIGGLVTVPPNGWAAIMASATASTLQANIGLLWEEIPV